MRGLVLVCVAVSIAGPALAIVPHLVLPPPYKGMAYLAARCETGTGAQLEVVRIQADGKLLRMTRADGLLAGATSRVEAARILRGFDRAKSARRTEPYATGAGPAVLNCSLVRGGHGRVETVALGQGDRASRNLRDLFRVLDDVRALGKRAVRPAAMSDDGRLIERKK